MTIASASNRSATYTGNGATTAFAFSFKIFAETDLVVTVRNTTTGALTSKTITTHYTVSGTGNTAGSTNYTSGTVTMLTAPTSSEQLIITCNTPIKQEVDYTARDAFPAETHEEALDRLTVIANEVNERATRGLTLDAVSAATISTALTGLPSAGQIVGVNDAGTGLAFLDPTAAVSDLGTMSTQSAAAVAITGGTITGITDITVADGGTGRSTSTAYAVICGGTTSTGAHQSIASVGTSGQVLTSNGAGALPTFQTSSSSFTTGTNSSTTMTFTGLSTGTTYQLVFRDVNCASSSHLYLEVSQDNGSTWIGAGTYSYNYSQVLGLTASDSRGVGVNYITLTNLGGDGISTGAYLIGDFILHTGTTRFSIQGQLSGETGAADLFHCTIGGSNVSANVNAVRIRSNSGNISGVGRIRSV